MKVSPITVGEYYTNSAIDNALEKADTKDYKQPRYDMFCFSIRQIYV